MLLQLASITALRWTRPLRPLHDGQVARTLVPRFSTLNRAGTGGQPLVIEMLSPSTTTASRSLLTRPSVSEPLVTVNRPGGHGARAAAMAAVGGDTISPPRSQAERPGRGAKAMDTAAADCANVRDLGTGLAIASDR